MIIGIDGNEANVMRRVGANQYAYDLLHALRDLPEAKKHDWVIYLRNKPLFDMPQIASWWKYKVFGPKYFWTQFALPFSLLNKKNRPNLFFSPGHYRPRWSPIPTVVAIMDLGYLQFPEQFTQKDLLQLTSWTARSIKKADHIIAISQVTKNDIVKFYNIAPKRITVTYPGYDKKRYHKYQNYQKYQRQLQKKYNIPQDYILFLGTLKPSKNIEGLLEAFSLITNYYSLITLVIAGKKGWLYERIFQKAKELRLEDKVVFTDYVDEEDKPLLLSGAQALVSPSFWEGFGIHLVEAMACGCPVVAGNVGSVPEVMGKAGVLVDPGNIDDIAQGIQKIISNRDIYIKRGFNQVKKFDWKETAEKTLEVLENIAKREGV